MEDKFKENEKKMKTKMDTDKLDFITQERELRAINESQRKIQESTILTLETEIAEKKAKMTQDLSEANMRAAGESKFKFKGLLFYTVDYYFMWSATLDSSDVLLSYS